MRSFIHSRTIPHTVLQCLVCDSLLIVHMLFVHDYMPRSRSAERVIHVILFVV